MGKRKRVLREHLKNEVTRPRYKQREKRQPRSSSYLGLSEEALGWLRAGWGLLPPHLLWTPTRFLSSGRFLTATNIRLRRCSTVSRCQLDFECDDLIPNRVGAFAIGNGEEFAQPATWILGLRWLRLVALHVNELPFDRLFWSSLFVVHEHIIPRTSLIGHTEPLPTAAFETFGNERNPQKAV